MWSNLLQLVKLSFSAGYQTRRFLWKFDFMRVKHLTYNYIFNELTINKSVDLNPVVEPILEILDVILWLNIAVVVVVDSIYFIILGVKISKCD